MAAPLLRLQLLLLLQVPLPASFRVLIRLKWFERCHQRINNSLVVCRGSNLNDVCCFQKQCSTPAWGEHVNSAGAEGLPYAVGTGR